MKLYIESIEGGTYLAAVGEQDQHHLVRDPSSNPMTFHCLNEIKHHFKNKHFEQVWLKQNTPYDEMCGLDDKQEKLEILIDWH
jgi:hypothetical protein